MSNSLIKNRRAGLSGTALKLLALVLMVMDHIHNIFEYTGAVPLFFSQLGRLSAPLFLFCVVEGFTHTHDKKAYFLRIYGISAGMGLIEFLMMVCGLWRRADGFYPLNGIFMDFVVLLVFWQGMDWLAEKQWAKGLAATVGVVALPVVVMALVNHFPAARLPVLVFSFTLLPNVATMSDGGPIFLLMGVALYAFRENRSWQMIAFAVISLCGDLFYVVWYICQTTGPFEFSLLFTQYYQWMEVFSIPLMLLYNGKRGRGYGKFFYGFYPAHVYILYAVSWLVYPLMG